MLIESIFSKEVGGPEKGRWVLSPEKGCSLLWARVAAERASPLGGTAHLQGEEALAAGRSSPTLPTHDSGMRHSLGAYRAGEPDVVRKDCPRRNQHLMG
jgi:hypothetical protein